MVRVTFSSPGRAIGIESGDRQIEFGDRGTESGDGQNEFGNRAAESGDGENDFGDRGTELVDGEKESGDRGIPRRDGQMKTGDGQTHFPRGEIRKSLAASPFHYRPFAVGFRSDQRVKQMLLDYKKLREMARMKVTAQMAGAFIGLMFGSISLYGWILARGGNQTNKHIVQLCADITVVFFAIAWVSIFSRILQLDSAAKRLRLLVGIIVGLAIFVADVWAIVSLEEKVHGAIGTAIFMIHAVVGIGGIGLFMMARGFAK